MFKFLAISFKIIFLLLALFMSTFLQAEQSFPVIKVGVLNFGTVNWELETIKRQKFDAANHINIEVVPLGSKNATHVAIQGGAVDVIVTDWIWVSRQRHRERDYTFVPYSTAMGSVIVKNDSEIKTLADLKNVKIGIAGGPLDKSWLLLSAYSNKVLGQDIADLNQPGFAAPPLLNELFLRDEFDAVLNFWHYTARLQALGNRTLIPISDILPTLGINKQLPMIGWVFSESWAKSNSSLISGFIKTSLQAKQFLLDNDQAWEDISDVVKSESNDIAVSLRDAYRLGIPNCFNQNDLESISKAFSILANYGGTKLVGDSNQLAPGTVWEQIMLDDCE